MRLVDTHGDYLKSPEVVARETNTFFIDMNKISHQLVEGLGPEKSKKLFCWVPKGTCRACPEGREDNTHLNVYGARLLSKLTTDVIVKEIKALSPFIKENDYVVANDGSGDFLELDKAVAFINNLVIPDDKPVKVLLRKGSYHGEEVKFSVPVNLVMEKEVEFEYK
jgi:pectinesterase